MNLRTTISLLASGCFLIIALSINLSAWHAYVIKQHPIKDTINFERYPPFDTLHSEIPYDILTSRKLETAD